MGAFRQFFDFLAKMGLTMRDDPKKVVDVAARQWGEPVDGLAMSIEPVILAEDRSALSNLSVALRNVGDRTVTLRVPGWLSFVRLEITGPGGKPVPLSPFGRELLKPERRAPNIEVAIAPGAVTETQIPIGSIFEMRAPGDYLVTASCEPADGVTLRSNTVGVTV